MAETVTKTVRLRVLFEEANSVLSRSKKKEGLERSWVLVKPQHQTISDLVSHLLYTFSLFRTCPNGIILSMDGFVLPPFESTCIFKDKDIVCVRKKETENATPLLASGPRDSPLLIRESPEFLADEEFEEKTGGYQSEQEEEDAIDRAEEDDGAVFWKKRKASKKFELEEEDAMDGAEEDGVVVSKKRKASKKLQGSKYILFIL